MTFTAVVVSHANEPGLRRMLGCLRYQTRPPDEVLVFCSDTRDLARLREDFPEATFSEQPDLADWGHDKRATGLAQAGSEWVGFFNDDDDYDRHYIEQMLAEGSAADVVFCEWNENPGCEFRLYQSTAGNFIVRSNLGRAVGWAGRDYEADGRFIEALNSARARVVKVADRLYTHNATGRNQ